MDAELVERNRVAGRDILSICFCIVAAASALQYLPCFRCLYVMFEFPFSVVGGNGHDVSRNLIDTHALFLPSMLPRCARGTPNVSQHLDR